MFDFTTLIISSAMAADAVAPVVAPAVEAANVAAESGNTLMRFMPLFLIFMVFYFLLIRPQQKKLDQQTQMINALKKGDKVVTAGGIVGVVSKLDGDRFVVVEIAKGVEIKVVKSTISSLADEKPANENKNK